MSYTLRDYQQECVDTVNALPDGSRAVVVLATGLGKTVTASRFAFHGRMLWLSHRDELVRQPEKYFVDQGYTYGIEKADEHAHGEDVVSASVQTLRGEARLHAYAPDAFDVIVVDEVQHAAAPTYRTILRYFHPRKLIGLTATPRRGDTARLTDTFDSICFERNLLWGIRNHYLSDIRNVRVMADIDLSHVRMQGGDYAPGELEAAMIGSDNVDVVTRAYLTYAFPDGAKTLIYCPSIRICTEVVRSIRNALPRKLRGTIAMVSGSMDGETRRNTLQAYRDGTVQCIVNCMLLTEGVDLPDTTVVINDRPSANSSLYEQIIGRGTRLAPGKDSCLVIDVYNENWREKHVCTAPTLFGLDPDRLPKKARDVMCDGKTLLSTLDAPSLSELAHLQEKLARHLKLKQEMVNIFTQERISLVAGHLPEGYQALANAIRKADAEENLPDFHDLAAAQGATDEQAYYVRFSYGSRIWFSRPDMLGRTVLTFEMPDRLDLGPSACISDPLPWDDAVKDVEMLLEVETDERMHRLWSKKAQQEAVQWRATHSQQNYLTRLYGSFPESAQAGFPTDLSIQDAGKLIDFALDLQRQQKEEKKLTQDAADARKHRTGQRLLTWEDRQREKLAREEEARKQAHLAWPAMKRLIEQAERTLQYRAEHPDPKPSSASAPEQDLSHSEHSAWRGVTQIRQEGSMLCVTLAPSWYRSTASRPATDRQVWFANLLITKLREQHNIQLSKKELPDGLLMSPMCRLIDTLKMLSQAEPPAGNTVVVLDADCLLESVQQPERCGQNDIIRIPFQEA